MAVSGAILNKEMAKKGRPAGSLNKATADVRKAAQQFTPSALKTLVTIMEDAKQSGPARVAACKEILDRAHGKSPQALTDAHGDNLPTPTQVVHIYEGLTPRAS